MTVRELARLDPVTVPPETSLTEAAQQLDEASIGSLIVVDGDEPVGIATDRDLALRGLGSALDPHETSIEQVMTSPVETIDTSESVYEALDRMSEHAVRRLPVVDDGRVVGIATLDDAFGMLTQEIALLESVLLAQSKRPDDPQW